MNCPEIQAFVFDSLDGQVNRAFASGAIDSDLIPSQPKPITFHLFAGRSALKRQYGDWRTNRQVYNTCCAVGKNT